MPNPSQWAAARARQALQRAIRGHLESLGYGEVETPLLVPAPGMEPHIRAFEVPFVPETDVGRPRTLFLHTSPEYAMKRLLADGAGPIFQICKVFRNGEVSPTHNPEFTMLELYRPHADYRRIMDDLESTLAAAATALGRAGPFGLRPYERITVREALRRETGIDLREAPDASTLADAARRVGVRTEAGDGFDDVFFRLFLERVEPRLGRDRPAFLIEYPASMAALARLSPHDPSVAERFELYAHGLELANGFSELTDAVEQRRRLEEERAFRVARGLPAYALDEAFLEAVGRMPPSGGVAIGLDRLLMLLLGAERIEDVLLFPAHGFLLIRELLHTVGTYAAVGSSAVVGPVVVLLSPGHPERADPVIRLWCNAVLGAAGVREEVHGVENLPQGTCVFVCNHQSNFDAPFIFARLPRHIRFVAKKELYRIPIFGAAVRAMGNIRVERTGGSEADHQAIAGVVAQVRTRTSILFFAEGTRSTDGQLRPFKKGAAILAIDAQVPIVPLAVAGAHEITPKGGLWVHSGRPLVLHVGKPIPTVGLTRDDRDSLTVQAHDAVAVLLTEGNRRVEEMLRS